MKIKYGNFYNLSLENEEQIAEDTLAQQQEDIKEGAKKEMLNNVKVFPTNTIVICAYHCSGSTTYAAQHDDSKDLEASMYSLKMDGTSNPDFPQNYIDIIKWHLVHNNWKYLFVSCHQDVIEFLQKDGIKHFIIYPEKSRKEEIINKCKERGNDEKFIQLLTENYDTAIDRLAEHPNSYALSDNEFITDELFESKMKFLKQ